MDDIHIPKPNPALTAILKSPKMARIVRLKTEYAKTRYRAIVAKRSRRLAASARVKLSIGGYKNDRWVGQLIVGEGLKYGASHEFGHVAARSTESGQYVERSPARRRAVRKRKARAAKDLKRVLRSLRNS